MIVAVIADTHLRGGVAGVLPQGCEEQLRRADALIHAGDLSSAQALDGFAAATPRLIAVHGNVDAAAVTERLPAETWAELGGVAVAVIHDAGPRRGRLERLRRRFPDADAVVFGHSHMPLHEEKGGFQIFNPGSPTQRRRAPARTMGLARLEAGEISFEHVTLS